MYYFKVRNFEQFQHYKHRNPPWIRLYNNLLHDRKFYRLKDSTKYLAIGCFLLASQYDNKIPFDPDWITKELSLYESPDWQELVESEFIIPIDCDASNMLATCLQHASNMLARDRVEKSREEKRNTLVQGDSDESLSQAADDVFCDLPAIGKQKLYIVNKSYISEMANLYPGIDVEKETLRAKGWLLNNPKRGKTASGMKRFLGSWFDREQNKSTQIPTLKQKPTQPGMMVGKSTVQDQPLNPEYADALRKRAQADPFIDIGD